MIKTTSLYFKKRSQAKKNAVLGFSNNLWLGGGGSRVLGYDYFYVTLILLDGFPKYKFKALCVVFLSEPVAILKLTVGSIMDLVTHDGFPTHSKQRNSAPKPLFGW